MVTKVMWQDIATKQCHFIVIPKGEINGENLEFHAHFTQYGWGYKNTIRMYCSVNSVMSKTNVLTVLNNNMCRHLTVGNPG